MRKTQLLLLALIIEQAEEEAETFTGQLVPYSRRLRQGKIRRGALASPEQSAFERLFQSRHDDALVTLCGFDHRTFEQLHSSFKPLFDNYSPYQNRGRLIARHNRQKGGRRLLSVLHWFLLGPGQEAQLLCFKLYLELPLAYFHFGCDSDDDCC
jgi:hypothetical protein